MEKEFEDSELSTSLYQLFEFLLPIFEKSAKKGKYPKQTRILLDSLLLQAKYGNFDDDEHQLPNKILKPYKYKVYLYWKEENEDLELSEAIRCFVSTIQAFHQEEVSKFLEKNDFNDLSHYEVEMMDEEIVKEQERQDSTRDLFQPGFKSLLNIRSSIRLSTVRNSGGSGKNDKRKSDDEVQITELTKLSL
eukprot:snap_masked-scaffold_5-processed-gene-6.23-mRNA-1 protein AED:1.00 eAED:1.00 QI:0/-1/0/0/-1/1/1/0/190